MYRLNFLNTEELIKGCLRNDRECQRELFRRFAPTMLTVCRRYARHYAEAEDMVQDGFIKVYKNMDRFRGEGSFEGWVRRIMVNTALKYYRKSSFKKELIGTENVPEKSNEPTVLSDMAEEEILQVISGLPDGYRIVFNMYAIEGFSHREISEELGIKESTSRSQLVKARKMLQEKILKLHKSVV